MFGYRFSRSEEEQLRLRHLFASAMDHRAPVRVSYFKEKIVDVWSERTQRYVKKPSGLFVKVTRVVEPYAFGVTKAGNRVVYVVDRTPEGTWGPDYRTIRLDRVAFSRAAGRALATRLLSQGFICPSRLDFRELHPSKRALTSV